MHETHSKERLVFLIETNLVNGNDSGMIKFRRRFSLDVKSLQFLGRGKSTADNHLDRRYAIEPAIASLVNDAHPTPSDLFD